MEKLQGHKVCTDGVDPCRPIQSSSLYHVFVINHACHIDKYQISNVNRRTSYCKEKHRVYVGCVAANVYIYGYRDQSNAPYRITADDNMAGRLTSSVCRRKRVRKGTKRAVFPRLYGGGVAVHLPSIGRDLQRGTTARPARPGPSRCVAD